MGRVTAAVKKSKSMTFGIRFNRKRVLDAKEDVGLNEVDISSIRNGATYTNFQPGTSSKLCLVQDREQ